MSIRDANDIIFLKRERGIKHEEDVTNFYVSHRRGVE